MKIKALVLTGYGINCDHETKYACDTAGFQAQRIHLNDVLENPELVSEYGLIVFPGGFSFGDDLGSGVAFAAKIKFSILKDGRKLFDILMEHIHKDRLILGICNGFQILVRLGLIPAVNKDYGRQQATLAPNNSGYFIDRWVYLKVEKNQDSPFVMGMENIRLPVRHGEGRFITINDKILDEIEKSKMVVFRYADQEFNPTMEFPYNPNGSLNAIAGITDPTGRVLGLMPHPEAAVSLYQYPDWHRNTYKIMQNSSSHIKSKKTEGDGLKIFKNAYNYLR